MLRIMSGKGLPKKYSFDLGAIEELPLPRGVGELTRKIFLSVIFVFKMKFCFQNEIVFNMKFSENIKPRRHETDPETFNF